MPSMHAKNAFGYLITKAVIKNVKIVGTTTDNGKTS